MAKSSHTMDPRKAQLVGLECRERAMKLAASFREEWPDIPDEELLVAFMYAASSTLIAAMAARNAEAMSEALRKHEEGDDDDDQDDEDEDDKEADAWKKGGGKKP